VLELNQQPDYAKSVDDEVDTALAELMSRMVCSHSVEEFVEMDDDEQTTDGSGRCSGISCASKRRE
jgi:hypothetical protein